MTERCPICNNTGIIIADDLEKKRKAGETCDCRLLQIWDKYMGFLIRGIKANAMSPYVNKLVQDVLDYYENEEERHKRKIWKKVYLFDIPINGEKEQTHRMMNIYKAFFVLYLTKTKEYLNFKYYDYQKFLDMYWNVTVDDEEDSDFYHLEYETILLDCSTIIPNKFAFDTIRHLLSYYKERNIIIYMSHKYKERLKIRMKTDKGGYEMVDLDVSLLQLLKQDFPEFIDVTTIKKS